MNPSGITPLDVKVVVKPAPVEERTAGGIILSDVTKEQKKYAGTDATLVAVGSNAFKEWGDEAVKPKPGDTVHYGQYSGTRRKGVDGDDYILMNDEDVLAVVEVAA